MIAFFSLVNNLVIAIKPLVLVVNVNLLQQLNIYSFNVYLYLFDFVFDSTRLWTNKVLSCGDCPQCNVFVVMRCGVYPQNNIVVVKHCGDYPQYNIVVVKRCGV